MTSPSVAVVNQLRRIARQANVPWTDPDSTEVESSFDELVDRLERLDEAYTELETRLETTEVEIGAKDDKIADLENRLFDAEGRIDELER